MGRIIANSTGDETPKVNNDNGEADYPNDDVVGYKDKPSDLDNDKASRLTDWKKEPMLAHLREDLEYSRPLHDERCADISGWLDLRNQAGKERIVPQKNRSSVQPKLIRKQAEWRYPGLSEPFLNSDKMFNITPRTFEDKAGAEQNQTLLNWQFDTKIPKVNFIDSMVRTTVDEGTCVIRVGWDRQTKIETTTQVVYEYSQIDQQDPASMQIVQALSEAIKLMVENPRGFAELPEDLQASAEYSRDNRVAATATAVGEEKVDTEVVLVNKPTIKVVNIINFFIDPSCEGDWEKSQFVIYTYESNKSDLLAAGTFKNLDQVNWENNMVSNGSDPRDHTSEAPDIDARHYGNKKSKSVVYEYWGLHDINNDGILKSIYVVWIGNTIIKMEENPFPDGEAPFVVIPYMPISKTLFGEPDASLTQDNQRITGAVTRGMIDLLGRSANAQTGYAKGFLDPVNRMRYANGKDYEYNSNSDPRISVHMHKYPEIPQSALTVLGLQNQDAEALSGVKSFSGGITGEAYGKVATGIRGALDAASLREMSILRRLAAGMTLVGKKIMAMNQEFLEEREVVRVTNEEFITIKREDLHGGFDLIVDISTAGVDEQKSQDLGYMLQTMGPEMDPGLSKIILSEIADLKRMPALAERIRAYEAKPDPIQQELAKLQIEKAKAEIDLDKARAEELLASAKKQEIQAEGDLTGVTHRRDVEKQGAQAKGNQDLEVSKSLLAGETPAANIEAAVGFNEFSARKDDAPSMPIGRPPNPAGPALTDLQPPPQGGLPPTGGVIPPQ